LPKQTSVPVSQKTLKFLNDYKTEFGIKSLNDAVTHSVQWARAFCYIDHEARRSIQERLYVLEMNVLALQKQIKKLEEKINEK